MQIAITGGTGFVGKNLTEYLVKNNYKNILPIDLRRQFLKSGIDHSAIIIHLAGKAHDLKRTSDPEEYYQVNFELTKTLYDAFLQSEAEKFIFISSVKAAADEVAGILTEDVKPNPQTHYGKSKLMAEEYIQSQQLVANKRYYILRPCMIHGPGNKGNLNLLYNFIKKGIPYPLAAFKNQRSFLSIENLCFVIKELIERDDIPSGIYQVADDKAISTTELIELISVAINKKPHIWAIYAGLIRGLAKVGDLLKLPLNTERLQKLTENYVVSNQKIKLVIGKKLPVDTCAGISKTIQSFR